MSHITLSTLRDRVVSTDGYVTYTIDAGDLGSHDIEIDLDDYIDQFNVDEVEVDLDDIAKTVESEGELPSLIAELVTVFGMDTILEHLAQEEELAA